MRALAEAGYSDSVVLRRDTADEVLTRERLRIVDHLREREFESVTALAAELDRDKSAVKRDLDVLFEHGVVEYSQEGRRKRPMLRHEHVFVEPV